MSKSSIRESKAIKMGCRFVKDRMQSDYSFGFQLGFLPLLTCFSNPILASPYAALLQVIVDADAKEAHLVSWSSLASFLVFSQQN